MLDNNIWNDSTVCKQMSSGSFKNVTNELFVYKSFIFNKYLQIGFDNK